MIFERARSLLGEDAFDRLCAANVAIFGVGGVGGWCAEALVRTGVRHLTIVDPDRVVLSNVNRQTMATSATIGQLKVEALAARLKEISPDVKLEPIARRYDETTAGTFDLECFDCVVDAIDSIDCKALLIRETLAVGRPTLFSSMGAARRFDPTRIHSTLFSRVSGDRLAKALRRRFRESGGIPDFHCVWSDEPSASVPGGGLGSLMQVTAAFGMALASLVIDFARRGVVADAPQDLAPCLSGL